MRAVQFPLPPAGQQGLYLAFGRNKLSDLALVAVTVLAHPDPSAASGFRFQIALSAVSPTVIKVVAAQDRLADHPITPAAFEAAAEIAMQACRPIDDIRAGMAYRRQLVRTLTLQALHAVWAALQQ